jgi:hypothetical protein
MEQSTIKSIVLKLDDVMLAYAIVRVHEVHQKQVHPRHSIIAHKLHVAKHNLKGGEVKVELTGEELHVLRQYNLTYSANLSRELIEGELNNDPRVSECEILDIYRMATRVQLLFSQY